MSFAFSSMEIDLELPSCEQDKLEIGSESDKDVDIVDVADEKNVGEDFNSPVDVTDEKNVEEDVNSPLDVTDEKNVEENEKNDVENVNCPVDVTDEKNVEEGVNSPVDVTDQDDAKIVGVNEVDKGKGVVQEPQSGLEFESKEDAYSYYREYARSAGFGITIKASRRSKKSGKFIDIKIACSRFGNNRECRTVNPRLSINKTDCKACLHIKRREDGKWVVHSFVKEHNHEIFPQNFVCAISGRKKPAPVASEKKSLQSALGEEDVRVMFEHFMCMQDEDPNFFYAINFDHEKRLSSVFWVDAKCRHDYSSFCDAVFFDTYYVRNNYKIPFVPVVGVNHQFQCIFLGYALIGEETTSSFVWLMQTWLKAVGGQAPRLVITDQDKYLKQAVADVFTDASHCFCLWHVLTRIPENVGCFIKENEIFMAKFNKCIYQSWTVEQFEKKWWKLVDRFELRENEWVHSLYEDRKKWVPSYMQDLFLAGMSTKERSGRLTSFFDKYISQESTVKDFIEQYRSFQKDRYDMEADAALETQDKQPGLKALSPFEKQMSTIYTDSVFKKFQVEVLGLASCQLQKEGENEATVIFRVDDLEEHQNFTVSWNEAELKVYCLCHSFEYKGFLCRHAILVLLASGVSRIPSHYILKRWTKEARVRHSVSDGSKRLNYRVQRFNDLCKLGVKLGEEGSLSPETYYIAYQALESVLKHCVDVNNSVRSVSEPNMSANHGFNGVEEVNPNSSAAKSSKNKKSYKKRKGQTEPDGSVIRLQDSSKQMEQMKSRAHNLGNCYVPQKELEGELGSSSHGVHSYDGSQQSMQGAGQLNSISPIRDGYYGNQHATQGQLHSLPTCVGQNGIRRSMLGMLQGPPGFRAPTVHGCFNIQGNLQERSVGSSHLHGNSSKHQHDKHQPQ